MRKGFSKRLPPEGQKAPSGGSFFVCIPTQGYTLSDFLILKIRRRIPLKSFGLRKETTFIPDPPNKSFCTEPRQTIPAGQPTRPAKIAPEKNGLLKAPAQTQSRSIPCYFSGISQAAPPRRKMKGASPSSICLLTCSISVYAGYGKAFFPLPEAC